MNKNEKIEKEIEYWTTHQDLDRFNYGNTFSRLLPVIAILVSILSILISIKDEILFGNTWIIPTLKMIVTISIVVFIIILSRKLEKEPQEHNLSFMAREEMIKHRYETLGIKKDELNKEFEDIKQILIETKKDSKCKEARIGDYYQNKKAFKF